MRAKHRENFYPTKKYLLSPPLPVSSSYTASDPRSTTPYETTGTGNGYSRVRENCLRLPLPTRDMFRTMESQSLAVGLQDMHYSFNAMQLRAEKITLMRFREEVIEFMTKASTD